MREIKFRARGQIKWKIWHYGLPIFIGKDVCHIREENLNEYICDTDTLSQYTGLKDKNGKEIYEGDIIRYDTIDFITYNLVKWGKVEFSFLKKQLDGTIHRTTYQGLSKYGEVIGNIYENPTLWEEVKSMTTF